MIHILAVPALKPGVFDLPPERNAVIICTVAAALLRMSGRSDASVWDNPYYVPNKLVYYRLCREYGLFVTRLSVWIKTGRNHRAYRRLQQGKLCKYERWQIIE